MLKRVFNIQSVQRLILFSRFNCTICDSIVKNSCAGRVNKNKIYKVLCNNFTTSVVQRNILHPFLENNFAYGIITKFPSTNDALGGNEIIAQKDFEELLGKNWRQSTAREIAYAFTRAQNYCIQNNIAVEDKRFDNLVDGLIDNCEYLTSGDIQVIMEALINLPQTRGYDAHNFHDLWSCLDDICCWKMVEWDPDSQFAIANLWFRLNLGRLCDYIFVLIDRLARKAHKLTKEQLVNIFFYFNASRKRSVDFEYEDALFSCINQLTSDQMAVVAMGYFKTKTKIKGVPIMQAMVRKVTDNSTSIHEISLAAILKIIRFSKPIHIIPEINNMLDKITDEVPRLSELCCLHIALMGTTSLAYHSKSIQSVAEKLLKSISNVEKVRLKDIERILNVLSMFNYDPKTNPDFFKACFRELHREARRVEFAKYPRCLVYSLNYLSIRNIYSYELMDVVLDQDYITEIFGKPAKNIPRELLSLDCSIDIECPDYKGRRLLPEKKYKAAKWQTEFTPGELSWKKISASDQFFLDTMEVVEKIVSDKNMMYVDHILPHFPRADIVLCKDKKSGKFIEPPGYSNYVLGDVKFPHADPNLEWYAIVAVGWSNTVKDSVQPLGSILMKTRQLSKMGYKTVLVIWKEFLSLSKDDRLNYISRHLE